MTAADAEHVAGTKTLRCLDCGIKIHRKWPDNSRLRCKRCADARKRELKRVSSSAWWSALTPEQKLAISRATYARFRQNNPEWIEENKRRAKAWRAKNRRWIKTYQAEHRPR